MFSSKTPNKKQLLDAIAELENNPENKEKAFGDISITLIGGGLGAASAGTAAAFAGATAITGLTTGASWLGITLVAATPVGWIAGVAVAGAGLAYGISRLISGGSHNEGKLNEIKRNLKKQLKDIENKEISDTISNKDLNAFHIFLKEPLENDLISEKQAHRLISGVESGKIKISLAYQMVDKILNSVK
jgi:hypothetical protein